MFWSELQTNKYVIMHLINNNILKYYIKIPIEYVILIRFYGFHLTKKKTVC
jgi:hypothetical protein